MQTSPRFEALKERHAALDAALHAEGLRPNPDTSEVTRIKRQKLRIKDEMSRMAH